jgi:hypothetical protein
MRLHRRPRTIGPALTIGTLGFLLVGSHLWAQTAPLSSMPPAALSGQYEAAPRLFAGPRGDALRLWYRGLPPSTGGIVLAAASADQWQTLVEIIPPQKDVTAGSADLAVGPAGQLTIAYQWWQRMPTSSKQIRLAQSKDGGKTWVRPEASLDTSGKAFAPKVAWGRDQTLVVVWADEQRSNRVWDVYARRSTDGGVTWEPEQLLSRFPWSTPTDAYFRPELISDGDKGFLAVWVAIRSGRSRLCLSRSTDGGHTWADPLEITGQSQSVFGQRIVRAGERLFILWQDKRTGRDRLFGVSSSDNGVTWSVPTRIDHLPDDLQTDAFAPAVVMAPTGETFVAWNDARNGRDDIFVRRSPDGGRSWDDKEVRLDMDEAGTGISRFPKIARAEDGRLAVAWEDDRAGYEGVYVRTRSAGSRPTWGPEIRVEGPGPKRAARLPVILWTTDGSLQISWEVWDYVAGPLAVNKRIDGRKLRLDEK